MGYKSNVTALLLLSIAPSVSSYPDTLPRPDPKKSVLCHITHRLRTLTDDRTHHVFNRGVYNAWQQTL